MSYLGLLKASKKKKKKNKQTQKTQTYSESSDSQELWGLAARIRMDTQSL